MPFRHFKEHGMFLRETSGVVPCLETDLVQVIITPCFATNKPVSDLGYRSRSVDTKGNTDIIVI